MPEFFTYGSGRSEYAGDSELQHSVLLFEYEDYWGGTKVAAFLDTGMPRRGQQFDSNKAIDITASQGIRTISPMFCFEFLKEHIKSKGESNE